MDSCAYLLILLLACHGSSVEFNREYTGVTFSPYVKNGDGEVLIPDFGSYISDDVKTMLEVVSRKFSRVLTDTLGASRVQHYNSPYGKSDAIVRTAEIAADLNMERNNKSLTVFVGITESDWKNNVDTTINIASTVFVTARKLYSGTIGGFALTIQNTFNYETLSSAHNLVYSLRNRVGGRIGTKIRCDYALVPQDPNTYDYNVIQIVEQRKSIILDSDFVICMVDPQFGDGDPKNIAKSVFAKINHHQLELKRFKSSIDVMAETYWPSEGNETWQNIDNFREYWMEIDRLATKNKIRVWLREAFDNPWRKGKASFDEHNGWWKLTENNLIRSSAGYEEKVEATLDQSTDIRASYQESCNRTTRCNSRASLTCENGTCLCIKENEMTYDRNLGKCVVLSGERCSYTAIEILTDQTKEKRYSERLACVENATCKSDGFCGCHSDSFETSEGLCALKRGYNESCSRNEECQEKNNHICLHGNCLCNGTEAIYDENYGNCIGKVGASKRYPRCVTNAEFFDSHSCRTWDNGPPRHRDCDTCQCSTGYTSSKDGLCYGDYGTECHPKLYPCLDDFTCDNGNCVCHFPSQQVHHSKCISKVNGPCLETVRGEEFHYDCVDNAECRNDTGISECLCVRGYIKSADGDCKKAFGSSCTSNRECDRVPGAMLKCRDGVCSCGDFQIYDEQKSQCFGLVGANCNSTKDCVFNSYCVENRDKSLGGSCRCVVGMQVTSERKCVQLEGAGTTATNGTGVDYVADEPNENKTDNIISD